ncbi:hypothetical protein ACVWXO_008104 [Bradyrhizobium sp. LM2.7]
MTDTMYQSGAAVFAAASFTPAAAAYSAGDVLDLSKEFAFIDKDGLLVPPGALIRVLSTTLKIDQTAMLSGEAAYTLQLYNSAQVSLNDNDPWTLASADLPSYRGSLGLGTPVDLGAACYVKTQFSDQQDIHLTSGKQSTFGRLVSVGGATFTAVARQVSIYGVLV